jgi:alkylation response protein AidB-like acyl-CoA dehydrogenase
MTDTLVNMRDIRFVLYEMLDIEKLTEMEYFKEHSKELFDITLTAAYQVARDVYWPAYTEMDKFGVKLDPATNKTTVAPSMHKIWQTAKEGCWFGASAPARWGGQQIPFTLYAGTRLIFDSANTAAQMYISSVAGGAHLILSFGSDALKQTYLEKLFSGEWGSTMCLTEPQAGSSLSDVKTTATKATDGDYYLITGTKCFISNGDHDMASNIVHPVLARIAGAPPGVKGISLFVVPKYRVNADGSPGEFNDVTTAGVEHKLGIRGNATCTLSFGDNGACRGWLLGEANQGLAYMFQLMNGARIGTGLQAIGVATNAYQHALQYTRERLQGRNITSKDPTTPQIPIIEHSDVRRMLLIQKANTEGVFALLAYAFFLNDHSRFNPVPEEKDKASLLLDLLTPICKAYGSEAAYESIVQAIQCYGGYGFSEEFPLAQMVRDTKVFPIYEGTNNIQAMDLLGRKVTMKKGAAFSALVGEITKTVTEASTIPELSDLASRLGSALKEVGDVTRHLGATAMSGDIELYMYSSSYYIKCFSTLVISWLFLWQSVVAHKRIKSGASESDRNYYMGKLATARFYFNHEMPHMRANLEIMKSNERTAIDFKEEWF